MAVLTLKGKLIGSITSINDLSYLGIVPTWRVVSSVGARYAYIPATNVQWNENGGGLETTHES